MKKSFTKEFALADLGCAVGTVRAEYFKTLLEPYPEEISIAELLSSGVKWVDKVWFIVTRLMDEREAYEFSLELLRLCLGMGDHDEANICLAAALRVEEYPTEENKTDLSLAMTMCEEISVAENAYLEVAALAVATNKHNDRGMTANIVSHACMVFVDEHRPDEDRDRLVALIKELTT